MKLICTQCQRPWFFRRAPGNRLDKVRCSECGGRLQRAPSGTKGLTFGLGVSRQERIKAALDMLHNNPNCPSQAAERTLELEGWGQ